MSNTNSSSIAQPQPCPLAIDETGKPFSIPSDASFWRVRRHTGGRPHIVCGADRKPLILPLDYSADELLRLVGRGTYRLDLCNEAGEHLETVAIMLGEPEPELRNAAATTEVENESTSLPTTTNETRLVLEANVRATQMAFQHNERTLTASLKMAETLRDGVQVLASSQAEWIKAMASARGFFRNAAPVALPAPTLVAATSTEDDEDDEDDDDLVEPQPVDTTGAMMSLGAEVMKFVNGVAGFGPNGKPVGLRNLGKKIGLDLGAMLDWRKAKPTEQPTTTQPANASASTVSTPTERELTMQEVLQVYSALPDDARAKLDEIRSKLSTKEQHQLMAVFRNMRSADELRAIAIDLASRPVDETVAAIREQIELKTTKTAEKPAA